MSADWCSKSLLVFAKSLHKTDIMYGGNFNTLKEVQQLF